MQLAKKTLYHAQKLTENTLFRMLRRTMYRLIKKLQTLYSVQNATLLKISINMKFYTSFLDLYLTINATDPTYVLFG